MVVTMTPGGSGLTGDREAFATGTGLDDGVGVFGPVPAIGCLGDKFPVLELFGITEATGTAW